MSQLDQGVVLQLLHQVVDLGFLAAAALIAVAEPGYFQLKHRGQRVLLAAWFTDIPDFLLQP